MFVTSILAGQQLSFTGVGWCCAPAPCVTCGNHFGWRRKAEYNVMKWTFDILMSCQCFFFFLPLPLLSDGLKPFGCWRKKIFEVKNKQPGHYWILFGRAWIEKALKTRTRKESKARACVPFNVHSIPLPFMSVLSGINCFFFKVGVFVFFFYAACTRTCACVRLWACTICLPFWWTAVCVCNQIVTNCFKNVKLPKFPFQASQFKSSGHVSADWMTAAPRDGPSGRPSQQSKSQKEAKRRTTSTQTSLVRTRKASVRPSVAPSDAPFSPFFFFSV